MKIEGIISYMGTDGFVKVAMPERLLTTRRKAVKHAKRIKLHGCWISRLTASRMCMPEEFVFPEDIENITLKCIPIEVPVRLEKVQEV